MKNIDQLIGQLFCIGIAGPDIDAPTRMLLQDIQPGGVCLFARNIKTAEQTRELLDNIRSILPFEPMLAIDQEGGTVDRLRRIVTPLAPAAKVKTIAQARKMGSLVGELLRILGFNMDFAPVVDVVDAERAKYSNGLFTRPFGTSKEQVAELAGSFLSGLQNSGVVGCLKHFPGLGGAVVDSHEELPQIAVGDAEFDEIDMFPFRRLLDGSTHAVMVAHACYPNTSLQETDQNGKLLPASLSKHVVDILLREQLKFEGAAITDDLEMGAILRNYGIADACVMAVKAGQNMLAICAGEQNIRDGFAAVKAAAATGDITQEEMEIAVSRVSNLRSRFADPLPFDAGRIGEISNEIAEFNAELGSDQE